MSNQELKKQNEELAAKVAELEAQLKQVTDAAAAATVAGMPKGRSQALKAMELLKAGPVTIEQLKAVNEKYPSDPIYYVRQLLKVEVKTNRSKTGGTTYQLVVAEEAAPEQKQEAAEQPEVAAETQPEVPAAPAVEEAVVA